jgi:hypothetical protein
MQKKEKRKTEKSRQNRQKNPLLDKHTGTTT